MSVQLLAACSPGEIRIAVEQDGHLLDYAIWRPGRPDGVGDLMRGRIESVLPALGGAFVALGQGSAESGFLPLRENGPRFTEGAMLTVRVVRGAQGGKGPRLALAQDGVEQQGQIGRISAGADPLTRLALSYADAAILCDDPGLAAELVPALQSRITTRQQAWPSGIADQIDALADAEIDLPGGMRASIHPTPALVAIDMDGGGASGGRGAKPVAQFAANRAAIAPLLHQVRLRNLGGAILVDLAGLASRKRQALRPEIESALSRDPLQPKLLGFTALGLLEIVRPRIHPPLHELLAGPHAAALQALAEAARIAATPPYRLPGLVASVTVAAALQTDAFARDALARRAGRPISVRIDPALPRLGWRLDHG